MSLTGQTALITGASRGLGKAIARRLARDGASVCVNYRSSVREAEAVVEELTATGANAISVRADVSDPAQVKEMVRRVTEELGTISILVNNAGVIARGTLETFEPADLEFMRKTNVDGLIHVTRAVVGGMRDSQYGRIVNLTSIAGHGTALPGNAFYAATKAAVSVLTRRFAMELGSYGITVNAVAPGFILTDMASEGRTEEEYRALIRTVSEKSMVGHPGKADDIAHAVAFLIAPESSFITAQILTVDGGRMDYISHP